MPAGVFDERLEPFSLEDAEYLLRALAELGDSRGSLQPAAPPLPDDIPVVSIDEIDLEAMVSGMHGITDPIGQLKQWLEDTIKALTSWFADAVRSFFTEFYNTFIKPVLDSIVSGVTSIYNFLTNVPGVMTDLISFIQKSLTGLWDYIYSNVVSPLFDALREMGNIVSQAVSTIAQLPQIIVDVVSGIGQRVAEALSGVVDAIWSGLQTVARFFTEELPRLIGQIPDMISQAISAVTGLVGQLVDTVRSALEGVARFFTEDLPRLFAQAGEFFRGLFERAGELFQRYVVEPVTRFVDMVRAGLETVGRFLAEELPRMIAQVPEVLGELLGRVPDLVQRYIVEPVTGFIDVVSRAFDAVRRFLFEELPRLIGRIPEMVTEFLGRIPELFQEYVVRPVTGFVEWLGQAFATVQRFFAEELPRLVGNFVEFVRGALEGAGELVQRYIVEPARRLGELLAGAFDTVRRFILEELPRAFQAAFQRVTEAVAGFAEWFRTQVVEQAARFLQQLVDAVTGALDAVRRFLFEEVPAAVTRLAEAVQGALAQAGQALQGLIDAARKGFEDAMNTVRNIVDTIRKLGDELAKAIGGALEALTVRLGTLATRLAEELPEDLRREVLEKARRIQTPLDFLSELPQLFWLGIRLTAFFMSRYIVEPLTRWFNENVLPVLQQVANTVWQVMPDWLKSGIEAAVKFLTNDLPHFLDYLKKILTEDIPNFFAKAYEVLSTLVTDPVGFLSRYIVQPLMQALEALSGAFRAVVDWFIGGLRWLAETVWSGVLGLARAISSAFVGALKSLADELFFRPVEGVGGRASKALVEALKTRYGELQLMFSVAMDFLRAYWTATLPFYVVYGLISGLANLDMEIEPQFMGTALGGVRWRVNLRDMIRAFVEGIRDFYPSFLTGVMFGIAGNLMRPVEMLYRAKFVANYDGIAKELFADVLENEIKLGARVSLFVEAPTLHSLREWLRRQIAVVGGLPVREGRVEVLPRELVPHLATFIAHLKLRGLPQWYIDYLTDMGGKLVVTFTDRFGVTRGLWLSEVFELPTHSELARMTQRDILPGVDVMVRLGWVRGWPPDMTKMIYLLTFKYPSFEKLWEFYMRATAGMLWFSPPDVIAEVFRREAKHLGAGEPIPPLKLQENLTSPEAFKAFELALNTYFKWLEYSNFSWFTRRTSMYGINIGEIVHNALGGWTADSWIMADVAADIPTKIDMRWMSRYGIFLEMAGRFERVGVRFDSYAPLVKTIPAILEDQPGSRITVDLKWFSKLIQATGLHPAWVPIVTVAENIMAIADEMTLLRTGWLNLFKEGLLTQEKAEQYLAGLLKVSYQVGYWDPEAKVWRAKWFTLPVRWLPHERRLLQLRFTMDRILDLYREVERYVVGGVRTLALRPEEAFGILRDFVGKLNQHYRELTERISGTPMEIAFDEGYERLRIEAFARIRDIEAIERARAWWARVAGWILYRVAYGYVTVEDMKRLIDAVARSIPVHPKELELWMNLATTLVGIVSRERYPTPSQLATLSEIVVVPGELIEKALDMYRVPEEFREVWRTYIERRPLYDDFRRLLNAYYRARRYGIEIPRELEEQVRKYMEMFHFTDEERRIRDLAVTLEILVQEAREYLPTPQGLATLAEYLVLPRELVQEVLERRRVPPAWRDIWLRYIEVKPVKSDYRALITTAIRAARYGVITPEELRQVIAEAQRYGFTPREIEILTRRAELELAIAEAREYIPTPSMLATISEYVRVPDELIRRVFEARRVPPEWQEVWLRYIRVRPFSDDVRYLLGQYLRLKRLGVSLPREVEDRVRKILEAYGVTEEELRVRELAAELDIFREAVPTLGQLAAFAEYIEVPMEFVRQVLERRRVRGLYAELWLRYISARTISREVNSLASVLRRILEYYFAPAEVVKKVKALMLEGGWTERELAIFDMEVELRKAYRVMRLLIPTMRGFVADARYLPEWEQLLQDLLRAYGVDVQRYQKQIDYYRKLIRNRMVWRQIAWYRNRLVRAYANGIIDEATLRQRLQFLKRYGLSDEEIELIIEGARLEKAFVEKVYGRGR